MCMTDWLCMQKQIWERKDVSLVSHLNSQALLLVSNHIVPVLFTSTELRWAPIFQVYYEDENICFFFLTELIRTNLNGFKKKSMFTIHCPWGPLLFVQHVLLLQYFSSEFQLKYLHKSKWNSQFFPHFTWFWCETAHVSHGSLDHRTLLEAGPQLTE